MWEGWFQKLIARALFIHLIAWFYVDESILLCLKAEILENSSSLYTSFLRNYYIIYFANVVISSSLQNKRLSFKNYRTLGYLHCLQELLNVRFYFLFRI